MRRAVFLDRDGVINEDRSYLYRQEDFHFMPGIFDFCRSAQEKGYLLVIATNQSGIARGYYTEDDLHCLNDWMCASFAAQGVHISGVYYCPFHPDKGVGRYRKDSPDRKPQPGMLLRAARDFGLDLSRSVIVGDRDSDMEAGRRAGVGKLLLLPGRYAYTAAEDITVIRTLSEGDAFLK